MVPIQGALSDVLSSYRIRSWRCLAIEKKTGRELVVVVSPDAVIQPAYGWACDCGQWTFGNDKDHVPVSTLKADAKKRHDAKNKRRQKQKTRRLRQAGDV